jgi:hypothetical protein
VSGELQALERGEWYGVRTWASHGGSKPSHSDPTERAAMARNEAVCLLEQEYQRLTELIEEAGVVVEQIGKHKSQDYARAVDWYYLQGVTVTWWDVARELSIASGREVSAAQAKKWRDRALEWVDRCGWDRVLLDARL